MVENLALKVFIYVTSSVILSEVVLLSYRYVRAAVAARTGGEEIAEVIWTNELTQTCAGRHRHEQASSRPTSPDGSMEQDGRIAKLPSPTATPLCNNRFCAANNVGRLIALIDNCQYSIDLAMYTFTSYELSKAFSRALRRGVKIRIISDKEMVYSSGSQIIGLTKAGIPVRCPSTTMLMHHKYCILDGPTRIKSVYKTYDKKNVRGILMSGSLNWTMQGFGGNWENILITSNKNLVQKFENEYQRMWIAFDFKL